MTLPPPETLPRLLIAIEHRCRKVAEASRALLCCDLSEVGSVALLLASEQEMDNDVQSLAIDLRPTVQQLPARHPHLKPVLQELAQLTGLIFGADYARAVALVAETAGIPPSVRPAAWSGAQAVSYAETLALLAVDEEKRTSLLQPPSTAATATAEQQTTIEDQETDGTHTD